MTRCGLRIVCVGALVLAFYPVALSGAGLAEETTGLAAATALEDTLTSAIAQGEKSVVAIARIKRSDHDLNAQLDLRQDSFNRLRPINPPRPGDHDFIPNEYATGVVVDATGLILTAHHVLREDSDYYVTTADRKFYRARFRAADPRSDLAVLELLNVSKPMAPITFGDASKLKKGQIVIALGNPYAIARDGQASASFGIVANLSRKDGPTLGDANLPIKPSFHQYGTLIQTDAKLNLGTSGGALVNLKGEMVGLTVSLAASLGYEQAAGFALPVDDAFRRALEALKQGREVEYGLLGVELDSLTLNERASGRHGARVNRFVVGTPAQRVGLMPNDVITHVDGQPIYDPDQLMLSIGKLPAGAQVRLTLDRGDGRSQPAVVELAKFWVPGRKIVTNRPPAWRGIRVDYVTASREFASWAQQGQVDPQGSVLITDVEQNSPAWKEGLRPDMMISHVGNNRVADPKQFHSAVSGKTGPVQLRLNLPPNERRVRTISPDEG
ncbi:MAG: trypsin-like peptidase domain-containing protein [Planctomycetia bacterium]|nr:trypsin-like peptidase domain-containing protein [Planctomycetia bacterium]